MNRYTFWLLLAACLVVAAVVYMVQVRTTVQDLEAEIVALDATAERAEALTGAAVGPKTVEALRERQEEVRSRFKKVAQGFARRDAECLERWFEGLDVPWSKMPLREDFKRLYSLGVDQLLRDADRLLRSAGVENETPSLIEYPWMSGGGLPEKDDLRHLQREFWIQDRIVRSLARHGAWTARPIKPAEVGAAAATGPFDRLRYDVLARVPSERLRFAVHAFDAPWTATYPDGSSETIDLPVLVDNVSVRRLTLDTASANRYPGEPPVEASFYLTVLDLVPERVR